MLNTERTSTRYHGLDTWDDHDILSALLNGQFNAIAALRPILPNLAAAAQAVVERLQLSNSRLFYLGAGASGLLALQDGLEMPQTFGWPRDRLILLLAGGIDAALIASGKDEDDSEAGVLALTGYRVSRADVVIAVAASGTTPYTVNAVRTAREHGALTVALANNADTPLLALADHPILLDTGPEVIAGSTRLAAGTAQKAALNLLSTLVMTRLGHVIDGHMVNVTVDNAKLRARAARMLVELTGCSEPAAQDALVRCHGRVKTAALVLKGLDPEQAEQRLQAHGGHLRHALEAL